MMFPLPAPFRGLAQRWLNSNNFDIYADPPDVVECCLKLYRDVNPRWKVTGWNVFERRPSTLTLSCDNKMNLALIDPFQLSQDYPDCLTNELRK